MKRFQVSLEKSVTRHLSQQNLISQTNSCNFNRKKIRCMMKKQAPVGTQPLDLWMLKRPRYLEARREGTWNLLRFNVEVSANSSKRSCLREKSLVPDYKTLEI